MKRENATAAAQDLHADDEKTHFFLIVFPLGNTGCPVNKKTLLLTSREAGQHAIAPGSISKEAHTPVDSNEGFCMSIRQF